MEILRLAIALLLPWWLGVAWLRPCLMASPGGWPLLLGYGYILGILVTTLTVRFVDAVGLSLNFTLLAILLTAISSLGTWVTRNTARRGWSEGVFSTWREQTTWQKWVYGLLLGLIMVRIIGFAGEIIWRPLHPWDAWTTWSVRARVWFEFKQLIPFVDATTWLADTTATRYTIDAWRYPVTVSLLQLWTAIGYGQWDESINNLPWLLCVIALGMGFYGQARLWGGSPLQSMLFTYLLLSMPLLNVHVALAGYADLWMATVFGFSAIAFFQWLRTGDYRQGLMALALALFCPLIKSEGTVWLLTFIPPLLLVRTTLKQQLGIFGALIGLLGLWFTVGGVSVNLPWVGEMRVTPKLIQIPNLGQFVFTFRPNWDSFVQNFFILANWHLFWYLLIVVMLVSAPQLVANRVLRLCSLQVWTGFLMLFVLFFMTEASQWADLYTSNNRLFLHMVPMLLFYVLILLNAVGDRRSRIQTASVPQPA